jgi:hypothetical protein
MRIMLPLDLTLTDDERTELVRALRAIVTTDRFPLSPRVRRLKRVLDKLEAADTPVNQRRAGASSSPSVRAHRSGCGWYGGCWRHGRSWRGRCDKTALAAPRKARRRAILAGPLLQGQGTATTTVVPSVMPTGMPWGDDEIDGAAAASGADEASAPLGNREIGALARGLDAGTDIDTVQAAIAPGPQQQISFRRAAERRRPRAAFVALTPHCAIEFATGERLREIRQVLTRDKDRTSTRWR